MNLAEARHLVPEPLLEVQGLAVRFDGSADRPPVDAVDDATLEIARGETVCLVGESGSGKSVTALSLLRLTDHQGARIVRGDIRLQGRSIAGAPLQAVQDIRGRRVAMVFQEPMTAFDPVFTIGQQIVETIVRHEPVSRRAARARALELLEQVQMPDAALRLDQIPQQLSGGMRQRAMIAMALACRPQLLVADEPTTALDVTIQAQILALLKALQRSSGMAVLLITHDLGVAAQVADRVVVMYAGRVVEQSRADALFARPGHPYTRGLLRSAPPVNAVEGERRARLTAIPGAMPQPGEMPAGCRFHPRCALADARCASDAPPLLAAGDRSVACWHAWAPEPAAAPPARLAVPTARVIPIHAPPAGHQPLIEVRGVSKQFASGRGWLQRGPAVRALDGVSLSIQAGETFGLVGESGCGKSTLGRLLLRLDEPTSGELHFDGRPLAQAPRGALQMIFQDPHGSIDPRWTVEQVIAEPLVAQRQGSRAERAERVRELLQQVGLPAGAATQAIHQFSGGQRQRIGIARAIALDPRFIVADEPVSALDLSIQAQVINLLADLRERLALTTLFIGHGLDVVRHLSDRVGVMYLGRLVEVGSADALFARPAHHYTKALIDAIPAADPTRRRAVAPPGELPSPTAPPPGCHYHPRCPAAKARCRSEAPALTPAADGRLVACHFPT